MHLRVYNYNTMEKVKEWEAHTDYIRYVEVHPNRPFVIRLIFILVYIILIFCVNKIRFLN